MFSKEEIKEKIEEAMIMALAIDVVDAVSASCIRSRLYEEFGIEG